MDNFKIIRDLTWIKESLICRMTGDAQQSLENLILKLTEESESDHFLLIERLYICQALLNANQIAKAGVLLATVLDHEMMISMKQLNQGQAQSSNNHTVLSAQTHASFRKLKSLLQKSFNKSASAQSADKAQLINLDAYDSAHTSPKRKLR